jgi:hypothetical protein
VLVDLLDDVEYVANDQRREAEGGFVHHHKLRAAHERTAYRKHLLFAARQRAACLPGALLEAGEEIVNPVDVRREVIMTHIRTYTQVFVNRQVGENAAAFRHERDAAAHDDRGILARNIFAFKFYNAALGLHEPRNGAKRGAFTRAVGADEGDDIALWYVEADALDGLDTAVVDLKVFDA